MSIELQDIFPTWYKAPQPTLKFDQVIVVNWLEMEVPHKPMPALDPLKGWRNREVFFYVKYEMPDWTAPR